MLTICGRLRAVLAAAALAAGSWLAPGFGPTGAAQAACVPGADACPIRIRFRPGTDRVTVFGRLTRHRSRVSYAFRARARQTLTWTFRGPAIRTVIRYPNGDTDGPGLPHRIRLPRSGTYVFTVSSNLMADGIFGPFRLTLRIR
jgi:hypothetical protein